MSLRKVIKKPKSTKRPSNNGFTVFTTEHGSNIDNPVNDRAPLHVLKIHFINTLISSSVCVGICSSPSTVHFCGVVYTAALATGSAPVMESFYDSNSDGIHNEADSMFIIIKQ